MKGRKGARTSSPGQAAPVWSNPDLPPDQFLYGRAGPWPQPAPTYPLLQPPEVLNIPEIEQMVWNQQIGARYLATQLGYGPTAAAKAKDDLAQDVIPDEEFVRIMTQSLYARFLRPAADGSEYWTSDFTAMELLDPLPGTYCAPVTCYFKKKKGSTYAFDVESISFAPTSWNNGKGVSVSRKDKAWNLAKVYACQGAAYHSLFVVHPALHFPMDSVNAITKTVVPHIHPLFQALLPHTAYTLALDNAVQESPASIVSNHAPATWFDPLTANAYSIKKLFGVGYSGYKDLPGYPSYHYTIPWMGEDELLDRPYTPYGECLKRYFKPFLTFCTTIASVIRPGDPYASQWAHHCNAHVTGFPQNIFFQSKLFGVSNLAAAMAIYMWDVTVSHGADHYSYFTDTAQRDSYLIIRRPPPKDVDDGADVKKVQDVALGDDLARAEIAREMFFSAATIAPNLFETDYTFTDSKLRDAIGRFRADLRTAASDVAGIMPSFMRLEASEKDKIPYNWTLPASIQF